MHMYNRFLNVIYIINKFYQQYFVHFHFLKQLSVYNFLDIIKCISKSVKLLYISRIVDILTLYCYSVISYNFSPQQAFNIPPSIYNTLAFPSIYSIRQSKKRINFIQSRTRAGNTNPTQNHHLSPKKTNIIGNVNNYCARSSCFTSSDLRPQQLYTSTPFCQFIIYILNIKQR